MKQKVVLVTGAAGFIGAFLCKKLLETRNSCIIGIDNLNDYYDVSLKKERLKVLSSFINFTFIKGDLADKAFIEELFKKYNFDIVVNLAAQAGVRYSIDHPEVYMESNVVGFLNVLECCRYAEPRPKLLYASSSSVYGGIKEMPFREDMRVDTPISLYAATKKSNELMAHCYSHLFGLQALGFRFFTVYGPWGRPDMATWLFADAMSNNKPIKVFNNGNMYRDFTYIDDIVEGLVRCVRSNALPQCDVFNIGNNRSERLMDMIEIMAREMGFSGIESIQMEMLPMQAGDVPATYASVDKLNKAVGYEPRTPIAVGLPRFVSWYKEWRKDYPLN